MLFRGPSAIEVVDEVAASPPPSLVHPGWRDAHPWLVQGTTTRGHARDPFDLGLYSGGSTEERVRERWERLAIETRMDKVVHARQVHADEVRAHGGDGNGLVIVDDADAHVTNVPGVLLAVTAADCVPVTIVDPSRRAVAMVHAGWRGAAAGALESTVNTLSRRFGSRPADLLVHLGPAICGRCYEVGPEVFAALGLVEPPANTPIDLRAALGDRATALGVPEARVSVSSHCTRCTGSGLFSHRGGDLGRHVGYVGIRAP